MVFVFSVKEDGDDMAEQRHREGSVNVIVCFVR